MQCEKHPRWNPNKSEKRKYTNACNKVTAQFDLSVLENSDKLRGLCGVDGAYQLDHIIPIQYGFENSIPPEIIGHIDNLQFIPWEENNAKRDKLIKEIPNGIDRFNTRV
jgi:5-methylcytosine-specific restriction endonuclease McrA